MKKWKSFGGAVCSTFFPSFSAMPLFVFCYLLQGLEFTDLGSLNFPLEKKNIQKKIEDLAVKNIVVGNSCAMLYCYAPITQLFQADKLGI